MSQFEYGIGGTERPSDASEAISQLPDNKTLFLQKLTDEDAMKPEVVSGLTNVEEVFEHYRPKVEMEFTDAEGAEVKEELSFRNLGDFGPNGLTNQSDFLQGLKLQGDEMNKIIKQMRSNKILIKMMQDPQAKAAFLSVIQGMMEELDQNA